MFQLIHNLYSQKVPGLNSFHKQTIFSFLCTFYPSPNDTSEKETWQREMENEASNALSVRGFLFCHHPHHIHHHIKEHEILFVPEISRRAPNWVCAASSAEATQVSGIWRHRVGFTLVCAVAVIVIITIFSSLGDSICQIKWFYSVQGGKHLSI